MRYLTVVPSYGRDYQSGKAARADFESGKDFTVCDMSCRWDGMQCNREDLLKDVPITVNIRYKRMSQITQVVLK